MSQEWKLPSNGGDSCVQPDLEASSTSSSSDEPHEQEPQDRGNDVDDDQASGKVNDSPERRPVNETMKNSK